MAEYIERENESICRSCFHSYVCEQFNEHRDWGNEKCHFFNDHFVNTDDVVKVRHGAWKTAKAIVGVNPATLDFEIGDADRCSLCGVDFEAVRPKYKYCPNCGAKMDGKGEGE